MRAFTALSLLLCCALTGSAQQTNPDPRLQALERKLDDALSQLEQINGIIQSLREDISRIRSGNPSPPAPVAQHAQQTDRADVRAGFAERIIEARLGRDERNNTLLSRPEIFIQARYSAAPIRGGAGKFEPNISLTRIETRWSGKLNDHFGAGLEIQYHPAPAGSPEELVNDAFIEYYAADRLTIRTGQFVKPFGFHIQQSSALRESPERAMFAGYFFPGQRDRGAMVSGVLGPHETAFEFFIGAFNGNRFFNDTNRQVNYVARARKLFDRPRLALGVSAQLGKQPLPEGVRGSDDENVIGVDFQYAAGRFGFRGELVAGNMPSTLLSIKPQFAPAFRPGAHSSGGYLFGAIELTREDSVYARYDQFNGDPVTGANVRAFNFGYVRRTGESSRLGFDYQFKNRPSFNDDAVNGRFHITWGITF
jgi:hypothetical protein